VPADHDAIGAMTVAAYEPFLLGVEDGYRRQLRDAAGRDRDAELWVATPDDSDDILGNVTNCPAGSPWRELAGEGEGEFRMLAVSPAAQRQGVGQGLTEVVVQRCRDNGDRAIVLSSLEEMTGAHRIYARLGFERAPDLDWRPEPDVSLVAFRMEL